MGCLAVEIRALDQFKYVSWLEFVKKVVVNFRVRKVLLEVAFELNLKK